MLLLVLLEVFEIGDTSLAGGARPNSDAADQPLEVCGTNSVNKATGELLLINATVSTAKLAGWKIGQKRSVRCVPPQLAGL